VAHEGHLVQTSSLNFSSNCLSGPSSNWTMTGVTFILHSGLLKKYHSPYEILYFQGEESLPRLVTFSNITRRHNSDSRNLIKISSVKRHNDRSIKKSQLVTVSNITDRRQNT